MNTLNISNTHPEPIIPSGDDVFTLAQAAEFLGIPESKVKHMIKQRHIVSLRAEKNIPERIPKLFFDLENHTLTKHISGLLAVLSDGGFTVPEMINWIFTPQDDLLPGQNITPAQALHTTAAREVIRRAQSLAL